MSSELVSLYCRVLTTPFNMLTRAGAGFRAQDESLENFTHFPAVGSSRKSNIKRR